MCTACYIVRTLCTLVNATLTFLLACIARCMLRWCSFWYAPSVTLSRFMDAPSGKIIQNRLLKALPKSNLVVPWTGSNKPTSQRNNIAYWRILSIPQSGPHLGHSKDNVHRLWEDKERTYTSTPGWFTFVGKVWTAHIYIYNYNYVCIYIYIHMYVCIYIYIHMYVLIYNYIYTYTYISMYTEKLIQYVYIYIYIHTHT